MQCVNDDDTDETLLSFLSDAQFILLRGDEVSEPAVVLLSRIEETPSEATPDATGKFKID